MSVSKHTFQNPTTTKFFFFSFFRCSIGSASSLNFRAANTGGLFVPPSGDALSIRRVSQISHINELRREMSGMDHLDSNYYEVRNGTI